MRSESFENKKLIDVIALFMIRVQTTLLQILKIWTGLINASTTFNDKNVAPSMITSFKI